MIRYHIYMRTALAIEQLALLFADAPTGDGKTYFGPFAWWLISQSGDLMERADICGNAASARKAS